MNKYSFDLMYRFDEQDGETALMMATGKRRDECVSILITNGADVNMAMEVVALCFRVGGCAVDIVCLHPSSLIDSVEKQLC